MSEYAMAKLDYDIYRWYLEDLVATLDFIYYDFPASYSIFGEVGLISGRRRGSTIRAAEPTVVMELSRQAALKLLATAPSANRAVNRISIERQLLQLFGSGLTKEDVAVRLVARIADEFGDEADQIAAQ